MDITRATLDSLFTGFKTSYRAGMAKATLPLEQIAMVTPSTNAIEEYDWLELLATVREWVGPRVIQNFKSFLQRVVNKDFEMTVGVKRNDIKFDRTGHYDSKFQTMGLESRNFWARLAIEAYIANATWIDGKAFFAVDHDFEGNTINNLSTEALDTAEFNLAYETMMSYKAHNGAPLNIIPDLLIVGPKNRGTAFTLLKDQNKLYAGGNLDVVLKNENFGLCDFLVHPMLVGDYEDYWFLAQTKGVVKPCNVQQAQVGQIVAWDQDHDANVKDHNRNDYGLHHIGAASLTLPPLCYAGLA